MSENKSTASSASKKPEKGDRKRKERPSSSSSSSHGQHGHGHRSHLKDKEKTMIPPNIWNKESKSDFICLPQFHNNLPNAPCGPYLKNIELLNPYSDFSLYKTSSLEKNHIWQPHFGPDLGLRLDLVDQVNVFSLASDHT